MTISTVDTSSGPYVGNGIADTFEYDFKIFDKTQLTVLQTDTDGVTTTLAVDSDYTVTNVGEDDGGDIVLSAPLAADYQLFIRANIPVTQETDFESQGGFFPDVHEDAFDKLTLLIQQNAASLARAVRLSEDLPLDGDFVISEDVDGRRNKVLRFDNNGDVELVEFGSIEGLQNFKIETVAVTAGVTEVTVPFTYIPNTNTTWVNVNGAYVPRSAYSELPGKIVFDNALAAGEVTFFGVSTAPVGTADAANVSYRGTSTVEDALDGAFRTVDTLAELPASGAIDEIRYVKAVGVVKWNGIRWVTDRSTIHAEQFGVVADGSTYDSAAAQAAIDHAESLGGGTVLFPVGTCLLNVELPSNVILVGQGYFSTIFKCPNGANDDVVRTKDFATLTGSNTWLTSAGNIYGCGVVGIGIDGNKANNASGAGLKFYAKNVTLDVLIWNTAQEGFYSEGAKAGGQNDQTDLPESSMKVRVWGANGAGVKYRGPHDGYFDELIVSSCASAGASFEDDGATYSGTCDIGFAHVYGNLGVGVNVEAAIRVTHLASESNDKEGLKIAATTGNCQFDTLHLFKNSENNVGVYYEALLNGGYNVISNLRCQCDFSAGGVRSVGAGNQINGHIEGQEGSGIGALLDGAFNGFTGTVRDFSGASGVGIQTATSQSVINASVSNCETLFDNSSSGKRNNFTMVGFANAGQAVFSGAGRDATEEWDLSFYDTDTATTKKSITRGTATVLSGTNSIAVTHNLPYTPAAANISVTPNSNVGFDFWISAVGATTFTINTSGAVAADKLFVWQIN